MSYNKYYSDDDTGFFCPLCKGPVIYRDGKFRCEACIEDARRAPPKPDKMFLLDHQKTHLRRVLEMSVGREIPDLELIEILKILEAHFSSKGDT